ncbi:DUF1579 family protein [Crossiella sp. CA198]|uniref:DUF1579 family protein n=1 Tax=Crossiella sp. CA198 TaxID=3455607 RepID=UPI003F8CFAF7
MLTRLLATTVALTLTLLASCAAAPASPEVPTLVRNGQPGPAHQRLQPLIGEWEVEMRTFIAGGTAEKPLVAKDVKGTRRWVEGTGGRHLQEELTGTFNGGPYYRLGWLAHANMAKQYEFVTIDALNAAMMSYHGASDNGSAELNMTGEFVDQGVLGDAYIGKTIRMRTVIRFETPDRQVIDLLFTPPGEPERLADRKTYTRR